MKTKIIFILMIMCSIATAQVAYDARTSFPLASVQDITVSHTGTNPKAAFFFIAYGAGDDITGANYGGVAMTEISGSPNIKAATEGGTVHIYFLGSGIPNGTQTVTATGTSTFNKSACVITLTAGNDTEVVDTDVTINSNSVANPSATLNLGGNTCWAGIAFFSGQGDPSGITPLGSWTSIAEIDLGPAVAGYYRYNTIGSSDVTIGWTQTADDAIAIGVAVKESAATSKIIIIQ